MDNSPGNTACHHCGDQDRELHQHPKAPLAPHPQPQTSPAVLHMLFSSMIDLFTVGCSGSSLLLRLFELWREAAPLWVCGWPSLVAEHGLKGTQGLVVVARGISRSEACGLSLDQGLNLSPELAGRFPSTGHQESLLSVNFSLSVMC